VVIGVCLLVCAFSLCVCCTHCKMDCRLSVKKAALELEHDGKEV